MLQPKPIPQQLPSDTPFVFVRAAREDIAFTESGAKIIGSSENHGKEVVPGERVKKVVLWDKDPRHPDGELFLSGMDVKQAFLTARVKEYIASERLVVVDKDGKVVNNWKVGK